MVAIGYPTIPEGLLRLPATRAALAYAERLHAGQRRDVDGAPFIVHPLEVACLLFRAGEPDHVVAAGVLHDVIEKTGADASELRRRFGTRVTRLVLAVSEDKRVRGRAARKAVLREQVGRAGPEALTVFAADKISKVRELRIEAAPADRLAHYHRCLETLEARQPDAPLVRQLRTELGVVTDRTFV